MKTTDLQINDWVYCKAYEVQGYWKIDMLSHRYITVHADKEYETDYFFGIPITENILKLNGATIGDSDEDINYWLLKPNDGTYCYVQIAHTRWYLVIKNNDYNVTMPCGYVHELQHALRMCGLNDLSDNLKVE